MRLRRLLPVGFAAALTLGLASCSSSGTGGAVLSNTSSTAGESDTETGTPDPHPGPATTFEISEPPVTCENQTMDLMSTAFGAWLGSQIVPTDQPDTSYYFTVKDNQFNPCAELSWVTLEGPTGNLAHDPGNGNDFVDTVVFFNGENLIRDPAPLQFEDVTSVERVDAHQLTLTYRGEWEHSVTYSFADGRLHGEEQLPAEVSDNHRLDLYRAGPPAAGAPRPFGNANYRPWDHEKSVGRQYSLMMGGELITCDFANFNGVQVVCYSETSLPWPLMPKDPQSKPQEMANIAFMNFQADGNLTTDVGAFSKPSAKFEMLPADSVTRIGDIFIDTRSEVVKIHDVNLAYLLGNGVAEPVEVPTFQLDTSRHPRDLAPWEG
ncbi:LppP/LprE family lipoprotein [Corynebacterium hylobatis]|nr:LppP/LprE family lipoprotein [Corynebacterium hylobatis]